MPTPSEPGSPEEGGCDPEMAQFLRHGRGIRQVLQAVEDALIDAGYDDFVVATDRGTFSWSAVGSRDGT